MKNTAATNPSTPAPTPVSPKGRKVTAAPESAPALKLTVSQILAELLASGDFDLDIKDEQITAAFEARIAKLESRIAELEKKAGVATPSNRADVAALAKAGKGGK